MRRIDSLVATMIAFALLCPAASSAAPAKRVLPGGRLPSMWDQPKPEMPEHGDEAPASAGGDGSGTNSISFADFENGDMIVVGGAGSPTGHAGEWDESYYHGSTADNCIWSANTTPVNGVQREEPRKYRQYDWAYGLWVPSVSASKRAAARSYCRSQSSEPYDIASSKTNQARWYCSKLAWSSYRYTSELDLDADGGYWVWPTDLVNDSQTKVFASAR